MKKLLKTIAATAGIGMIGAGSAIGLTSCGENKELMVFFEQEPVTKIGVQDTEGLNKLGTIVLNVSILNKSTEDYYPATDIHEAVLSPATGATDNTKLTIKELSVVDKGLSIKFTIKSLFTESDVGMWSIAIWGKDLKVWTFSFEIVNSTPNL